MAATEANIQKYVGVGLDWPAYYRKFKEMHGKYPVLYQGRLLFPDGWRHAMSCEGPEYRPPENESECKQLIRRYWQIRKSQVVRELRTLQIVVDSLREFQACKSATLQRKSVVEDDKKIKRLVVVDLDFTDFDGRLTWLRDDIKECDEHLVGE